MPKTKYKANRGEEDHLWRWCFGEGSAKCTGGQHFFLLSCLEAWDQNPLCTNSQENTYFQTSLKESKAWKIERANSQGAISENVETCSMDTFSENFPHHYQHFCQIITSLKIYPSSKEEKVKKCKSTVIYADIYWKLHSSPFPNSTTGISLKWKKSIFINRAFIYFSNQCIFVPKVK